jgi:Uma2 family endonuclease
MSTAGIPISLMSEPPHSGVVNVRPATSTTANAARRGSILSAEVEATIIRLLGNEAHRADKVRVFASGVGYRRVAEQLGEPLNPTASVVRSARLIGLDPRLDVMPFAPDLSVEVVSPTDLAQDVARRIHDSLVQGFPLVWEVQPHSRCVVIYRASGRGTRLRAIDEITGESALPSFRCKVSEFFTK